MIKNIIKRVYNFLTSRIYVNETAILFDNFKNVVQKSPAKIVQANYNNLVDILTFQNSRYIKIFKQFLDSGDKGYFAYLDSKCVHRSWIQFGEKEISLAPLIKRKIKQSEAYIHYCETAPEARGKNIYPDVLSRIINDFKDKYKNIYISTNIKNLTSRRGIEKAGFRERESTSSNYLWHKDKKNLKIIVITMGLSKIVEPIVNSRHNVIGIIECAPRKKDKKFKNRSYNFVRNIYNLIKHKKTFSLSSFSNKQTIPYYYMNNGSDGKLEEWVSKMEPDLIVIYSMSQLLKRNIFSIPRYSTINLHPALLPKYRGPNPWFWMYYGMENKGGVTIHYIDEGEDTGDIIYQKSYQIKPGMRLPEMQEIAINKIGAGLLLKAIDDISNGKAPRIKQTIKSSTKRAKNIKLDEHKKIIDWHNWEIERIWHLLRGSENWLNATEQPKGIYKGQRWRILNYKKQKMKKMQVSKIYKERSKYFIACKDGKIYLGLKFNLKNILRNIF